MFKKQKILFEQLYEYMNVAQDTLAKLHDALKHNLERGTDAQFEKMTAVIRGKEQACDDIRRQLERDLFLQSLLPETREDIVELVEIMDQIPNHCEDIANMLEDQRTEIIRSVKTDILEMLKLSEATFALTVDAVRDCFGTMERINELVRQIDNNECVGNSIERKMIRAIFSEKELQAHPGRQLVQKEIVTGIGEMLDICKLISEKLLITMIKRAI